MNSFEHDLYYTGLSEPNNRVVIRCKHCDYVFYNYNDFTEEFTLPNCISDEEKAIKNILE